jgi:hypothetical protein
MRSASSRLGLRRGLLVLSVLLVAGVAAAAVIGASSSGVAAATDDDALTGTGQVITQTMTPDGIVTTTTEPEQLGTSLGAITPTWYAAADTTDSDAWRDAVATGLRTVYTTGYMVNEGSMDLHLAKHVDGTRAWERVYDSPAHGSDRGDAVAASGGRIYTVGLRDPKGDDPSDVLVVRWDSAGNRVWTRAYDSGVRQYDRAVDVAVDSDGNVVVAGYSYRHATNLDWILISYKRDGTRRWVRRYDGPSHLHDVPAKLLIDAKDRIYVTGYSTSASNGEDALLAKYSQTGTRLWAKRFNGSGDAVDEAASLRARPGGGVYVCGHTTSTATGQDGLLLAYSAAGSRLFATAETGDGGSQAFTDLEVMPNGDIICGGYDDGLYEDRFIVIYDSTGDYDSKSWWTTAWSERITALAKDRQGGVYLTGTWGTATGTQVLTQRLCDGGASWRCYWPSTPATDYEPTAIAVNGVNVYVVGRDDDGLQQDAFVLGHVY